MLPQDLIRGKADGETVAQGSSFTPKLNVASMDDVVAARDKDVSPRSVLMSITRINLHAKLLSMKMKLTQIILIIHLLGSKDPPRL